MIVESAIIVEHLNRTTAPNGHIPPTVDCSKGVYHKYFSEMQKYKGVESPVEWAEAEDPLFILYTRFLFQKSSLSQYSSTRESRFSLRAIDLATSKKARKLGPLLIRFT